MEIVNTARCGRPARFAAWLLILIVAGLLPGCTHFVDTIHLPPGSDAYEIYGSRVLGQAFVCHHAGLDGISVLLSAQAGSGEIILHFKESADSAADIAAVRLVPSPSGEPAFHHFALPLQDDVNGKSFFFLLESPESGASSSLSIPYGLNELSGSILCLDGACAPGYVSFKLHYSNLHILKDLAGRAVSYGSKALWWSFLSALLYLLPGGAAVLWLLHEGDWIERSIVAVGLSIAINAVLVYATMMGLRLNSAMVIGFLSLCGGLMVVRWVLDWRRGQLKLVHPGKAIGRLKHDPSVLALLAVFALILGVRLFAVRNLVAPMWGDSYQHTMMAQLMVENGGLFDSWAPYAPLVTFTYHFGFHANVALFHWLSGDPLVHSIIWVGQVLNALAVLALYPFASEAARGNRWAGVATVMIAGLLSRMPMYYVNWGRYTQLAGQVVLPVLMWLTKRMTEKRRLDGGLVGLMVLGMVGLGVIHYLVSLMYGVFVAAWMLLLLARRWGQWREIKWATLHLALAGGLALLALLPWGIRTFRGRIPEIGLYLVQHGNQSEFHRGEHNAIGDVSLFVPLGLLALSAVSLVWQAIERRLTGWVMALWVIGLLILANPYLFHLPGTGIVNNFTVFVMFYIPAGILAGTLVGQVLVRVWRWQRWSGRLLLIGMVTAVAGWGAWQRVKDLDLGYAMVTEADMAAMAWISENTRPDAKFLVNGFTAYGGYLVVGADAGWWIPLLTGRSNTIPPLTYGSERSADPNYREQVLSDFLSLKQAGLTSPQALSYLRDEGVTHAYVGQGKGRVGNPGDPLLDVKVLSDDPAYRLLYSRDGVFIFALATSGG